MFICIGNLTIDESSSLKHLVLDNLVFDVNVVLSDYVSMVDASINSIYNSVNSSYVNGANVSFNTNINTNSNNTNYKSYTDNSMSFTTLTNLPIKKTIFWILANLTKETINEIKTTTVNTLIPNVIFYFTHSNDEEIISNCLWIINHLLIKISKEHIELYLLTESFISKLFKTLKLLVSNRNSELQVICLDVIIRFTNFYCYNDSRVFKLLLKFSFLDCYLFCVDEIGESVDLWKKYMFILVNFTNIDSIASLILSDNRLYNLLFSKVEQVTNSNIENHLLTSLYHILFNKSCYLSNDRTCFIKLLKILTNKLHIMFNNQRKIITSDNLAL